MTPLHAIATDLRCDESRAAELFGTPLFYYALETLRRQIARLRGAISGYPVRLLFATMANDRAEILRAIAAEGVGACVNSVPHLARAIDNGFSTENMQFTSCGLPVADMAYLQSLGVAVNLDSPGQVRAWCRLKPGAVTGARINAASLTGSAPPDRIGMDVKDFELARGIARDLGGRVNGVHIYAGTNFQAPHEILPTLRAILDLAGSCRDVEYVNIGGGIGVDYSHSAEPFDYETFGAEVCSLARHASRQRDRPLALLFEPGRSLVASSGLFVTRVTDIKTLGDTRFVVVDASVSVFPRPYHHPGSLHKARVLDLDDGVGQTVPSTVVGRTTFSRDILGTYSLPANLQIGAMLAFEDAGAYCESMMSRFLGQRDPRCYISEQ
ncbi:MAG: diaminopimelate decarboxylase family protein [Vicinamibacterales bacterium]